MVLAVQCPNDKCRKYQLVEDGDRGKVVHVLALQDVDQGRRRVDHSSAPSRQDAAAETRPAVNQPQPRKSHHEADLSNDSAARRGPADWLIVPLWEDEAPAGNIAQLDERLGKLIAGSRETGDLSGKANELVPMLNPQGIHAERLLLVGLGKKGQADRFRLIDAASAAARHVTGKPRRRVAFALPESVPGLGWDDIAQAVGVGLQQGSVGPGIRKNEPSRFAPEEITLLAPARRERRSGQARQPNAPPCSASTSRWRKSWSTCRPAISIPNRSPIAPAQVAGNGGVECTVLDEKQLAAERMGSLLGVAKGSDRPPRLVVLRYQGAGEQTWLGSSARA